MMIPTSRRGPAAGALALTIALTGLVGCGDGTPPVSGSKTEATVKGTLKIAGKPVTEGEITFNPANVARKDATPRTEKIRPDGSYAITTLVGDNRVSLSGAAVKKHPGLEYEEVPYNVAPGENTFNIDFTPPTRPESKR